MIEIFIAFSIGAILGTLLASLYWSLLSSKRIQRLSLESEKEISLHKEKISSLLREQELKEKLQIESFEKISSDLVKKGSESLEKSSMLSLEQVIRPLREKLRDFESKVEKVYESEARERFNLKKEIERVALVSEGLSKTLRGDFKNQGLWGEIVLERVLEVSGLREGIEYTSQGRDLGLKSDEGSVAKPDVIVHLPEGKHLIVDSKLSLSSYERWSQSARDGEDRDLAAKTFASAVKQHVTDLSEKYYHTLAGLQSPDFVFLFFPIDSALVALQEIDSTLFLSAWKKRVVIVGPSTLLPTLRTVEAIWKNERQNQNALEIARLGGSLYDKMSNFCEDLLGLGKSLSAAQNSYEEALKKLRTGKGNLLRQAERLRELGVRSQKRIPVSLEPEDAADSERNQKSLACETSATASE